MMKHSIKREQSQAGLSFAERENVRPKVNRNRLLLLLVLLMTAVTGAWAQGPTVVASGTSGDVSWTLTDDGVMTISGTGAMANTTQRQRPWYNYLKSITSVVIEEGVTHIGTSAFLNCINLESATIPASVTSIGNQAFLTCTGMTSVTIADGSSLTSIDNSAFYGCISLGSISLPASVTSIGQRAFNMCNNLATVTLNSNPFIGSEAFDAIKDGATVTMNLTANSAGGANWTTFYNQNYGFEADANTEVFKVALSGTSLTMNKVANGIVDAGTAVVLKTTGGNPVMTLTTSASSDTQDNSLTGVSAAAGATSDGTFYVLDNGTSGLGFYKVASGGNVPVGNAYLTSDSQNDFLSIGGGSDPAEPSTYTVSFAKDTEDADNWTGKAGDATEYQKLPLEGVAEGAALTLKYDGTKKVKSVKAVKKAEAPHLVIEDKNNFFGIGNQKFYFTEGETWTEAMANHPENAAAGWIIYNDRLRFKPDVYGYAIFILRSGDYYTIEDTILNQPIDTSKTYMFEGTNPT